MINLNNSTITPINKFLVDEYETAVPGRCFSTDDDGMPMEYEGHVYALTLVFDDGTEATYTPNQFVDDGMRGGAIRRVLNSVIREVEVRDMGDRDELVIKGSCGEAVFTYYK